MIPKCLGLEVLSKSRKPCQTESTVGPTGRTKAFSLPASCFAILITRSLKVPDSISSNLSNPGEYNVG
jgi:hypothetical protein